MQIKNLQSFRLAWKKREGYDHPNWDENFIGSSNQETSGFYKMVNGIVGNIRSDLTPKLQNAQDEQAIYEFLQNAADSQSTDCAIIYDEEYLMILNNGTPFSNKDLQAILNTFQGTKADKAQEGNCDKIGRYGVGFKLAYRLLGKSDGVNELLDELAGPIIFSWNRLEQFRQLLALSPSTRLMLNSDISDDSEAPWLLKIILACFPAMLDESVKNLAYEDQVVFKQEELQQLVAFLSKHQSLIKHLVLSRGSLFFLKFGPKKHQKLLESLINLKSGIGYSLNTLKSLSRIVLQDELIEKYPISFEKFSIQPGTEAFKKIDPEFPTCPIEISLGVPDGLPQAKQLRTAPNLYQFFPMRNERHNLAFFVHGTSFAKITDRTRLDNQGEANRETFHYLNTSLQKRLNTYQRDNFDQFIKIYRAILFSGKPDQYNSELLNDYLYHPLLQYIRANIPTHSQKIFTKDLVVIKDTVLDVDPITLGIGKEWFYWTNTPEAIELKKEAANSAKLDLKRWGIQELIQHGETSLINNWIRNLREEEYQTFVEELKSETYESSLLKKISEIKAFRFSNSQGEVIFYSLEELVNDEQLFLLNKKTAPIQEILKEIGFSVLAFNLESYTPIFQTLKARLDYLTNDKKVFQRIAEKIPQSKLSPTQKQELLDTLINLEGVSEDNLRGLELFTNQAGKVVSLFELIANDLDTEKWLEPFKVSREEHSDKLKKLSINESQSDIYSNIIHPYWKDILPFIDHLEIPDFYKSTLNYYQMKRNQSTLQGMEFIYVDRENRFQNEEAIFFHPKLIELSEEAYEQLKYPIFYVMGLHLPDFRILSYLTVSPFQVTPVVNSKQWSAIFEKLLNKDEVANLPFDSRKALFIFFQSILRQNEVAKLKLFHNQDDHIVALGKILSHQLSLPEWLHSYSIKPSEYFEELDDVFLKEGQIFDELILPYWDMFISQDIVLQDPHAFYEKCLAYFLLGNQRNILSTQAYVYTQAENPFQIASAVFYHRAIVEVDNQEALIDAISALTGKDLPHASVLPFYQQKPFLLREQSLLRSLKVQEVRLDSGAIIALQYFLDHTNEHFFNSFYVEATEEQNTYTVAKRGSNIPYFVEKSKTQLNQTIKEVLGEKYKLLPEELYLADVKNVGLQTADVVYQRLSRIAPPEKLSSVVAEEGSNPEVQKKLLDRVSKVVLKEGQKYTASEYEFQLLQLIQEEDVDLKKLRAKIYLQDIGGKEWSLNDIGFRPSTKFRLGKRAYELSIASVLPSLSVIDSLPKTIASQFSKFPNNQALKAFLYKDYEKSKQDIFTNLQKNYRDLTNATQLAFVIMYAQDTDSPQHLRYFSVSTKGGNTRLSEFEAFHLEGSSFIDERAILTKEQYEGLDEILRLDEQTYQFIFCNQQIARSAFTGINSPHFVLKPLKQPTEEEQVHQLRAEILTFIHLHWLKSGLDKIDYITQEPLNAIYGLIPDTFILPQAFALESELIPQELASALPEDLNEVQKELFYTALGVNGFESDYVLIRSFLQNKRTENLEQINAVLKTLPQSYIQNTMYWVHEQKLSLPVDSPQLELLLKLYQRLTDWPKDLPIPVLQKPEPNKDFHYQLTALDEQAIIYVSESDQAKLKEEFSYSLSELWEAMAKQNAHITTLKVKGIETQSLNITLDLDLDQLNDQSTEWRASHYHTWKQDHEWEILLIKGQIPYKLCIQGEAVKTHQTGDILQFEQRIYVNESLPNIEESLFELSGKKGLKEKSMLQLLRLKNQFASPTPTSTRSFLFSNKNKQEIVIRRPKVETIRQHQEKGSKGKLHLELNLGSIPEDMLEQIMQIAEGAELRVKED